MSAVLQPRFAPGSDVTHLSARLSRLLSAPGGKWSLTATGEGVERSFKFKTFAKTWDFMTAVSLQCKIKNHHPEWSNVYNTAFVRWTTHRPRGLSAKDVDMAGICDAIAEDFGEITEAADADAARQLQGLADTAASTSGDCCVPKGQQV